MVRSLKIGKHADAKGQKKHLEHLRFIALRLKEMEKDGTADADYTNKSIFYIV